MLRRACLVVLSSLLAAPLAAQASRYELGRRLRTLEQAWGQADAAGRARASSDLDAATRAFFGLAVGEVARRLDAARFALLGEPVDDARCAAAAWACVPDTRLLDAGARSVHVRLERVYELEPALPGDVRVEFRRGRDERALAVANVALAEAEAGLDLDATCAAEGVDMVRWRMLSGERVLAEAAFTIGRARDLLARIGALGRDLGGDPGAERDGHDAATLRYLARRLDAAARGRTPETDLPFLQFLRDAEAITELHAAGRSFVASAPRGERWLCLQVARRSIPVRIDTPAGEDATRRPLLLLLHGAGGSENMFFDAYGAGTYVERARARGWIVAAPGSVGDALGGLADLLAELYPIDRTRVWVVGHSMGAMQAIAGATRDDRDAATFAAVAALGGGGRLGRATVRDRRFFVAVGAQDFARAAGRTLATALSAAGAGVEWHEYPATEHLGVVQRAADDVFTWLDGLAGGK